MEEKLVTVFIPVFNAFDYIEETLNSVIDQTYKNLEILIINDGSTDGTLALISKFKDPRIRVIDNKVNKGLPFTRNLGLVESKGEYIAFLDADDIADKNRISKQVYYLDNNYDIDLVFSNMGLVGKKKLNNIKNMNDLEIKYKLLFRNIIGNSTVMLRKTSVIKYKMVYNYEYFVAQDYRFWSDGISKFKFGHISETLVYYRYRDNNVTSQSYKNKEKSKKRLALINKIHESGLNNLNIILDKQELALFNSIFNESKYAEGRTFENIKHVYTLLLNEKLLNNVNRIEWNDVVNEEIMLVLTESQKLSLSEIRYIFWRIIKKKNVYMYIRFVRIVVKQLISRRE